MYSSQPPSPSWAHPIIIRLLLFRSNDELGECLAYEKYVEIGIIICDFALYYVCFILSASPNKQVVVDLTTLS